MRVEWTNLTKLVRGEPNANNELVPKGFFGTADVFPWMVESEIEVLFPQEERERA